MGLRHSTHKRYLDTNKTEHHVAKPTSICSWLSKSTLRVF